MTTLPSVIYHVYKSDGTMVKVDNPHNYPDPGTIDHTGEPYVKVSIIAPQDYVGNIMPMCQERRGEFKDMQYLDTHLVELHYQMPLNEIIYDFFDTLKANTKGYASLDYELSGYRTSDLVKVDLLLNGDGVDALSFIAHRDKAYGRARRLCVPCLFSYFSGAPRRSGGCRHRKTASCSARVLPVRLLNRAP